ncbi:MAG: cupredoxin domain-containing protein [bacterium]|nr:cupredoxin domain-containing protein [bacterium]
MNKNTYLVIGLLLVFVAAGFIFIKQKGGEVLAPTGEEVSPTSSPSTAANLEVVYTASGFSPKALTVKAGDTVVFKNNGGEDFWPASGPHPTHTNYPEFDAKKAIPAGGSYSFTFTRIGSWKYHNHLNPGSTGTITVQ